MDKFFQNPLVRHSTEFSLMVIRYVGQLEAERKFIIAKQLLRSATSVGACIMEAQTAESKADFIHKLKIADKEAHETLYWLYLCEQSEGYPHEEKLKIKLEEVMRILNTVIISAKKVNPN